MFLLSNVIKKYKRATPKQLMLSGVFMLAFAAAIGAGFASQHSSSAAVIRDWAWNSIDNYQGGPGPGAANEQELIDDINRNIPGDLKGIYAHFGLTSDKYSEFIQHAKTGMVKRNGNVYVDGESQPVMTNTKSMGRDSWGWRPTYPIQGVGTYYYASTTQSMKQDLPVMILFDNEGTAQTVVMNACGNPVWGDKVRSGGECKDLVPHAVDGKKNTYTFTTDAYIFGLAKYGELRYYYQDGNEWKRFDTQSSPEKQTVQKKFTKTTRVKVEVDIYLPGGKVKRVTCIHEIEVEKEHFEYVCKNLIATPFENNIRKFRFTVITKQTNNVTVDSADFTLDGSITTKGVTNKDDDDNFFKDYEFDDTKTHTVSVIVNFTADGKTVTSKEGDCVAEVTPEEEPKCVYNPQLPPDHPKCKPPVEKCVPEGKEDENCELPSTGPAGVAGLVAGVTAAGAVGHRLFTSRRRS